MLPEKFKKDWQYYKFCFYGFLKNQRFFEFFLLLIFYHYKGLTFSQIGVLYSIRFVLRAIFEIPSGFMADAMGRKGIMLISYGMYMVSFISYHYAPTFAWLIIPSVCFGIADSFRTGTHKAMIFEYLKRNNWQDQKVTYYGHTRGWSQAGSAISSLIGAALVIFSGGYQSIFLYSLIPYSMGFILLSTYPGYLEGPIHSGKEKNLRSQFGSILNSTIQSFRNLSNILLTVNVALFSGFYHASKDYIQLIISASALSLPFYTSLKGTNNEKEIVLIGVVYFIIYFITSIASRKTNYIGSFFHSTNQYINYMLLIGLAVGLVAGIMYNINCYVISLVFFVIIFVVENLRKPAGIAIIAHQFDNSILASVLSVESQLSSVLGAVMSLIIGLLADWIGPGYAISVLTVILLACYPLIKFVKPNQ